MLTMFADILYLMHHLLRKLFYKQIIATAAHAVLNCGHPGSQDAAVTAVIQPPCPAPPRTTHDPKDLMRVPAERQKKPLGVLRRCDKTKCPIIFDLILIGFILIARGALIVDFILWLLSKFP